MVFSSEEIEKRPIQTKVYYKLFYSVGKETTHKPSKVATAKNLFSRVDIVDVIGATCLSKCSYSIC